MTASAAERAESARWLADHIERSPAAVYRMAGLVLKELDDLAAAPLTAADGHLLMMVGLLIDQLAAELAKTDPGHAHGTPQIRLLMMIGERAYRRTAGSPQVAETGEGA